MKKASFILAILVMVSSCVSKAKYDRLMEARNRCTADSTELALKDQNCNEQLAGTLAMLSASQGWNQKLVLDSIESASAIARLNKQVAEITDLNKQSLDKIRKENEAILKELELKNEAIKEKEKLLDEREKEIDVQNHQNQVLATELALREQRVKELEAAISAKDSAVELLRNKLLNALQGYTGSGLSVTSRDGRVYVSMEEKLLFASGSVTVGEKGEKALLDLSAALKNNKDIDIMVEGHTDNQPISAGQIKDNWDLSVLRATTITRILTQKGGLENTRVLPAGRGEYMPVSDNKTAEGRAKNRRTEIVVTPNMDKIMQIIGK